MTAQRHQTRPAAPNDVGAAAAAAPIAAGELHGHLAERILPGLTPHMQRPRFLTAIAVGALTCDGLDDDEAVTAGRATPAWRAFEWYAVEAISPRAARGSIPRLPGGASRLEGEGAPSGRRPPGGAPAYLKAHASSGFNRIYEPAAIDLGILGADLRLDEGGYELLGAWEADQHMDGFVDGSAHAGARLRAELTRAVERGLTAGHPVPPPADIACQIARCLCLGGIGPRERRVLQERLRSTRPRSSASDPIAPHMRRELIDALEARGTGVDPSHEAEFLSQVRSTASSELASRLAAIDAYERVCCRQLESARRAMRTADRGVQRGGAETKAPVAPAPYMHDYRTPALSRFLADLSCLTM